MAFRIALTVGRRVQRRLLGSEPLVVSSDPEGDLFVPSALVSRRHARLRLDGARLAVEDLGSTNGTFVAGERLTPGASRSLSPGESFVVGNVEARFEEVADDDVEPALALPARPEEPAAADGAPVASATTASLGSLRVLAVDELPALLDAFTGGGGALRMAQRVADVLARSLPCRRVEVVGAPEEAGAARGGGAGVLFVAASEAVDEGEAEIFAEGDAASWIRVPAGPYSLGVRFLHPQQAEAFAPLVGALARLVRGAAEDGPAQPPRGTLEPPSPPDPPTAVPAMRRLYERAAKVAAGDISVLILGESGTGKEVLARFVHRASSVAEGPFVALNCAALPNDLLEAELFGIEERVATGVAARAGKFELADGGTLFLDEIGDMSAETQARILRVLQEREVYRIGGSRARPARVRTLAATNRDLAGLLDSGGFRKDLYHRIADWTVTLPPLRERRADIPNLAAHFLAEACSARGRTAAGISRGAMSLLAGYRWPGNIRQLERQMRRAALFLEEGQLLERSHLDEELRELGEGDAGRDLKSRLAAFEKREIEQALASHEGDVTAAAAELGVGRSTLYRRMAELEIERG